MNKKGAGVLVVIVGIILLLVVVGAIYWVSQSGIGTSKSTNDCGDNEPYLEVSFYDGIKGAGGVSSVATSMKVNDGQNTTFTSGSSGSKFALNDEVVILGSLASYIDTVYDPIEITQCGVNRAQLPLDPESAVTLKVYNSDGDAVTNLAILGGTNQSSSATSFKNKLQVQVDSDQSVGDMLITLEYSNKTQIQDIDLKGTGGIEVTSLTGTPAIYTSENTTTTSFEKAWVVKGLEQDGGLNELYLTFEPATGHTIDYGTVYLNGYIGQAFMDVDGSYVEWGYENGDRTAKYEGTGDFDFVIN